MSSGLQGIGVLAKGGKGGQRRLSFGDSPSMPKSKGRGAAVQPALAGSWVLGPAVKAAPPGIPVAIGQGLPHPLSPSIGGVIGQTGGSQLAPPLSLPGDDVGGNAALVAAVAKAKATAAALAAVDSSTPAKKKRKTAREVAADLVAEVRAEFQKRMSAFSGWGTDLALQEQTTQGQDRPGYFSDKLRKAFVAARDTIGDSIMSDGIAAQQKTWQSVVNAVNAWKQCGLCDFKKKQSEKFMASVVGLMSEDQAKRKLPVQVICLYECLKMEAIGKDRGTQNEFMKHFDATKLKEQYPSLVLCGPAERKQLQEKLLRTYVSEVLSRGQFEADLDNKAKPFIQHLDTRSHPGEAEMFYDNFLREVCHDLLQVAAAKDLQRVGPAPVYQPAWGLKESLFRVESMRVDHGFALFQM